MDCCGILCCVDAEMTITGLCLTTCNVDVNFTRVLPSSFSLNSSL